MGQHRLVQLRLGLRTVFCRALGGYEVRCGGDDPIAGEYLLHRGRVLEGVDFLDPLIGASPHPSDEVAFVAIHATDSFPFVSACIGSRRFGLS
jgi:hypothetical protein